MPAVAPDVALASPQSTFGWIGDINGSCTHVDDGWIALTGRPRDAHLGDGWIASIHADDRDALLQVLRQVLRSSMPSDAQARVLSSDGHVHTWRFTFTQRFDDMGAPVGLAAIARHTAKIPREATCPFAEDIFEQILDSVCVAGFDGYFKRVNLSWIQALGWSVEELMQRPILDFVHPEDREAIIRARQDLYSGTHLQHLVNRYRCKDGSYRWMQWKSVSHLDRRLVYAVARDITEQKLNEERLRDARDAQHELQRQLIFADRMASVGTLAAGVAHEINTPLTYILTNIDMIALMVSNLAPDTSTLRDMERQEIQEMLTEARDGAHRIRSIVGGLKTFSRAEDDHLEIVDLAAVIKRAIAMTANQVRHRARLSSNIGPIPLIEGNPARIGQVLVNLLLNAAQAIPEVGAASHSISLTAGTTSSGAAYISIRDTGVGIASEHLSRVFDPFFTTRPHAGGTGLGLSIGHSIATAHGGSLTAESSPGSGSTFTLTLPATNKPATLVAPSPASKTPAPTTSRIAILVVDDEPAVGRALQRALSPHEVRVVTSGEQAISLLEQDSNVDLIFSDLMMPEMSGIDLFEHIQHHHPHLAPRVVFISGGAFTERARNFLEHVPNLALDKPFDLNALCELVQRFAPPSEEN
ncbi:PAS domain S-box protein [Lujinxingia vulgaris]|uniref:histidine kinase n=1 Tax=Lujinxingia vulgaris TaxID=2600176 RepID=A0A5C6XCJ3_9DELT|nr:ATP-binding protein [Lujinxingia vulgaris]TXD37471.1 PAS domain S-box protein [Lujinxingia vulgaris]